MRGYTGQSGGPAALESGAGNGGAGALSGGGLVSHLSLLSWPGLGGWQEQGPREGDRALADRRAFLGGASEAREAMAAAAAIAAASQCTAELYVAGNLNGSGRSRPDNLQYNPNARPLMDSKTVQANAASQSHKMNSGHSI